MRNLGWNPKAMCALASPPGDSDATNMLGQEAKSHLASVWTAG